MMEENNIYQDKPFSVNYMIDNNEFSPRTEYYSKKNGEHEIRNIFPDATYHAIDEIDKREKGKEYGCLTIKNSELLEVLYKIYKSDRYIDDKKYGELYCQIENKMKELNSYGAIDNDGKEYIMEDGSFWGMDMILDGFVTELFKPSNDLKQKKRIYCFSNNHEYALTNLLDWFTDEYQEYFKKELYIYNILCIPISTEQVLFTFLHLGDMNKQGVVYKTYVMKGAGELYKIGRSIDPVRREQSLLCGNPDIQMLFFINSDIEQDLHKKFADKKVKGEWFKLTQSDLDYIKSLI